MSEKKNALVVDLDGTLLRTNTFSDYIYASCCETLRSCQWSLFFSVVKSAILRKLRFISHAEMKYLILSVTSGFMEGERLSAFVKKESEKSNDQVAAVISDYKAKGFLIFLATAAPDLYAQGISMLMGFDGCVGTPLPDNRAFCEWQDNKCQNKVQNLQPLLSSFNAQIAATITDHIDDLPLAACTKGEVFLCTKSKTIIRTFENSLDRKVIILG